MRNELVHLQVSAEVVVYKTRQLRATFDAAESTAFPYTASDELECYRSVSIYQWMTEMGSYVLLRFPGQQLLRQ